MSNEREEYFEELDRLLEVLQTASSNLLDHVNSSAPSDCSREHHSAVKLADDEIEFMRMHLMEDE